MLNNDEIDAAGKEFLKRFKKWEFARTLMNASFPNISAIWNQAELNINNEEVFQQSLNEARTIIEILAKTLYFIGVV